MSQCTWISVPTNHRFSYHLEYYHRHQWALVQVPIIPFLIQLPSITSGKTVKDSLPVLGGCSNTHMGYLAGIPESEFWTEPDLIIRDFWEMNHQLRTILIVSNFVSTCNSAFQIKIPIIISISLVWMHITHLSNNCGMKGALFAWYSATLQGQRWGTCDPQDIYRAVVKIISSGSVKAITWDLKF